MPNKLIRACAVFVMTWLALFSAHAATASWQPSARANSAMTDQHFDAAAKVSSCANPYVVRKGDTLGAIAKRCGVSVAALQRLNGLRSDAIRVGQTLSTRSSSSAPRRKAPAPVPTPRIDSPPSPW